MMRVGMLCVALAACVQEHHGPGVLGSPADVTTPAGQYTGYRVVTACPMSFVSIGVIGTGSVAITDNAQISQIGQQLRSQLTDVTSIWGWGGAALGCEPGVGTELDLDDWRDVDPLIVRVGAFLHEHDYALQVNLTVESIPVPVAQ